MLPMKTLTIKNKVSSICKEKALTQREFIRLCIANNVCGVDAARKVFRGETNVNLRTAAGVSAVLQVPFVDAFEVLVQRGHSPRLQVEA